MKFIDYWRGLTPEQQEAYAKRAGTDAAYIRVHLLKPRRVPRPELMLGLIEATDGGVTREEMFKHFYPPRHEARESAA